MVTVSKRSKSKSKSKGKGKSRSKSRSKKSMHGGSYAGKIEDKIRDKLEDKHDAIQKILNENRLYNAFKKGTAEQKSTTTGVIQDNINLATGASDFSKDYVKVMVETIGNIKDDLKELNERLNILKMNDLEKKYKITNSKKITILTNIDTKKTFEFKPEQLKNKDISIKKLENVKAKYENNLESAIETLKKSLPQIIKKTENNLQETKNKKVDDFKLSWADLDEEDEKKIEKLKESTKKEKIKKLEQYLNYLTNRNNEFNPPSSLSRASRKSKSKSKSKKTLKRKSKSKSKSKGRAKNKFN
jgi:hypothetical protein